METRSKTGQFRVKPSTYEKIERIAHENGKSVSTMVHDVLLNWLVWMGQAQQETLPYLPLPPISDLDVLREDDGNE